MIPRENFDLVPKAKSKLNILPGNPESWASEKAVKIGRFPSWLHRSLPTGIQLGQTGKNMNENRLHTVCEEAKCPNILECWSKKTATFLIMGKACTRNCGFCDIDFSKSPQDLEPDEPQRVAQSVKELGLKHVVITMVARDDLFDGGAAHLVKVLQAIMKENPESTCEVLTSDFNGNKGAWQMVLAAQPTIFNHNIETVRELSSSVRHRATYDRTLELLSYAASFPSKHFKIKSGLMVGLGETEEQVQTTLKDLHRVGCDIVTIGQYLQPSRKKLLVKSFVTPEQFKQYEKFGRQIGIPLIYAGPFIRSSYNAAEVLKHG